MSKKTLTIVIIVFILIIAGMLVWAFFISNDSEDGFGSGGISDFFPFGRDVGTGEDRPPFLGDTEPVDTQPGTVTPGATAELKQLTNVAIAGATAVTSTAGGVSVRYVERATGNIYEVSPRALDKRRLSNTTIPAVREAFFNSDGSRVLLRYLNNNDVIKTFAGRILLPGEIIEEDEREIQNEEAASVLDQTPQPVGDNSGRLVGAFFEDDITFVTVSPDKERIFYLMPFGTNIIGITADFEDNNKEQVFDSPFTEWLPQWSEDDALVVTTKASGSTDGFLYVINPDTGIFEKIVGDIAGLTTLVSPDARHVLYSESGNNSFSLYFFDAEKQQHTNSAINTLPEKCVWSSVETSVVYCGAPGIIENGTYPDMWYQGLLSFSDVVWKINVDTGSTKLLAALLRDARQEIDVTQPFLSQAEEYLFFTNKKDSTLWSLRLDR